MALICAADRHSGYISKGMKKPLIHRAGVPVYSDRKSRYSQTHGPALLRQPLPLASDRRRPISRQVKCVGQERRRTPRFPFVATAEVADTSSGASVTARVSELSLYGCYIDMANPFPEGTSITVKIYSGGRHLDASGKVVYSAPNLGIGVSFHDVSVLSLIVLKEWLLLAAQAKYHPSG